MSRIQLDLKRRTAGARRWVAVVARKVWAWLIRTTKATLVRATRFEKALRKWRPTRVWGPAPGKEGPWRIAAVSVGLVTLAVPVVWLQAAEPPRISGPIYSSPPPSLNPVVARPDPDTVFLAWGPSQGDLDRALETAQAMPLDEAAGVVIIARFGGTNVAVLQSLIREYHVGGVSVTGTSIVSAEQVSQFNAGAQAVAAEDGRDWPFMIATDQEGGTVARLKGIIPTMPSFMAAGAANDKGAVQDAFAGMGRDMRALGFNMDFAPDADVTIGLADPIIRTRSAGGDPENVGESVIAAVGGLMDAGVIPAIKHFPGHGGVTTDSHVLTPVSNKTLAELERDDLVPFRDSIEAGAPMVMMSHVAVGAWSGIPASIDPAAYAYLREALGFTGVAITDSMGMGGLNPYGGTAQTTVAALQAGADIILMPASNEVAHDAIVQAVTDGTLSRERLDEAASRVIALMRYQASIDPTVEVEGDYVRALSQASATVVAPLCGQPLVANTVTISGGWTSERAALSSALAEYGIATGSGGTSIQLIGVPNGSATADVVVALDGPWGLSSSHATAYIGLYGRGPSTMAALADILVNAVDANALWPVPVPGLPFNPCPSPR